MTTDYSKELVARLRKLADKGRTPGSIDSKAADEVERLCAELNKVNAARVRQRLDIEKRGILAQELEEEIRVVRMDLGDFRGKNEMLSTENARLRGALLEILDIAKVDPARAREIAWAALAADETADDD